MRQRAILVHDAIAVLAVLSLGWAVWKLFVRAAGAH